MEMVIVIQHQVLGALMRSFIIQLQMGRILFQIFILTENIDRVIIMISYQAAILMTAITKKSTLIIRVLMVVKNMIVIRRKFL